MALWAVYDRPRSPRSTSRPVIDRPTVDLARPRSLASASPTTYPHSILIVSPPPCIRRRLRPTGRRVFPLLLPAIRDDIEERPDVAQRLYTSVFGEVGAIDI